MASLSVSPWEGSLQGFLWIMLACGHAYGGLFSLLTEVGRASPLWVGPFPRQGILDCLSAERE